MSGDRVPELARYPDCLGCQPNEVAKSELGGSVYETRYWRVSHCNGPFGEGTMVVEPKRHVSDPLDMNGNEEIDAIPVFRNVQRAIREVTGAERVYMNLWSHGPNPHIHWVFQPITPELVESYGGLKGPDLQVAMENGNKPLDKVKAARLASEIRSKLIDYDNE